MYIYIHAYMHACIHTYIHIHTCTYIHITCVSVYTYAPGIAGNHSVPQGSQTSVIPLHCLALKGKVCGRDS